MPLPAPGGLQGWSWGLQTPHDPADPTEKGCKAPPGCPEEPPTALLREAIAAGTPAAPARLPPPAGSQGSDQQPGFNPLNTGCIDPEPCSAPPCLASPPTPSRLICTALISRPANFSIRLLLTQGAQEMQLPTSPRPPAHCGWPSTDGVLWGPHAPLGTSHPSGASPHLRAGGPWCMARCTHTECPLCPKGIGEPPVPPFTHSLATTGLNAPQG